MFVRDIMTTNVVTIPSSTPLADARRIMDAHGIRRIPVVDKGKLVGVVSRDALDKAGPSTLTTFSMHEITYLLSKITVREVMKTDLVTVSPDATVEEAVAMAQSRRVGSLLVLEDRRLVGIATTNDFFYKIANPILGIDKPGARFVIRNIKDIADLQRILGTIDKFKTEIVTLYTIARPDTGEMDFTAHLNTADPGAVIEALRKNGYEVQERAR
jgi:acetoin utilization protein AcuB